MALPISNIPILTGEAAEAFVKSAKEVEGRRGSIDFSRQYAEWRGFDMRNAARIAKLRAEGKWPFSLAQASNREFNLLIWIFKVCSICFYSKKWMKIQKKYSFVSKCQIELFIFRM